ncbi:hypothetical protein HPB52_015745 [Rhipicephalus sanguineus]|uniref:Tick transposon n=1 Tax=Rhipicephalus sanguineus TaxID=34632 RepID=A0A9D4T5Y0_RHISA|nr:hypothetical protein HPB52_015745 [Rhipicephalus sanguineus]
MPRQRQSSLSSFFLPNSKRPSSEDNVTKNTDEWVLRTKRLAERYEVAPCRLTEKPQRDRRTKVREAVQEAESASWRTMAAGKPALSFYSKAKQAIEKEPLYENTKGSGLLCDARCGMLRTRLLRATYTPNLDTTCPLCTLEEESIEHIVLRCPAWKPQVSATSSAAATPPEQRQKLLAMALGFRESQERPQWETVEATKRTSIRRLVVCELSAG